MEFFLRVPAHLLTDIPLGCPLRWESRTSFVNGPMTEGRIPVVGLAGRSWKVEDVQVDLTDPEALRLYGPRILQNLVGADREPGVVWISLDDKGAQDAQGYYLFWGVRCRVFTSEHKHMAASHGNTVEECLRKAFEQVLTDLLVARKEVQQAVGGA